MTYQPSLEEAKEYQLRLETATAIEMSVPIELENGSKVIWAPQAGSQESFIACPVFEVLYEGTRGPGKTDGLIMSFAKNVGKGFGAAWRGVLFRQTYPQLADVEAKTTKWFRQIFGGTATFNKSKMLWEWDTGEVLLLRHISRPEDYYNYHGHEYPWIGWEELTTWPDDQCYKLMFSCCRTSTDGVPRMVRATTNPYGPGHNWVKDRWRLPDYRSKVIKDSADKDGRPEPHRVAIHGNIRENKRLLAATPDYIQTIAAAARNDAEREAWLEGSWDIVAGGMFDDIWYRCRKFIVVPPFEIPTSWRIDRSFDWGSSAPFSVGWWAESDGTDYRAADGKWMSTVRGDLFRINEWYGWTGKANEGLRLLATEISRGIVDREIKWGIHGKVRTGVADSSIFDDENDMCVARDMQKTVRIAGREYRGITWDRADKRAGSIEQGLQLMREMMAATERVPGKPRELPGLFVFDRCQQFMRTVPHAPRDEKWIDRIHKDWEDHVIDEVRYRCRFNKRVVKTGRVIGLPS